MAKVKSVSSQSTSTGLQSKFAMARSALCKVMIERDAEIDMVLCGLLIREHVLLVGPPGTGKSHLLNAVMELLSGKVFTYLMTKFSTPEELFGPYSISGLKQDKFFRVTKNRLPEAEAAYVDEIFKGSPAILNTLLTIMNEGMFDDGNGLMPVPLRILVGSSNEYPRSDEGLNAMLDRFLLRKNVSYIMRHSGRKQLLWGGNHRAQFSGQITTSELDQAISEVEAVPFSDEAKKTMDDIVDELRKLGITPSDRRLVKSLKIAQASAWLAYPQRVAMSNGASCPLEVTPEDFDLLSHSLWVDPENHPKKVMAVVAAVSNPMLFQINNYMQEAEEVIADIDTKNISNMAKSTTGLKKLDEILKRLQAMKPHPRVKAAIDHISEQVKIIKTALIS